LYGTGRSSLIASSRPVKLVMTLLVRDEADIVDSMLAFHLNAGVDFVIATDHASRDGTSEILERYVREGYAHVLRAEGDELRQPTWVTRMARLAATDFGADWVINSDADEFWWPRGKDLKDVLAYLPARYGIVRGLWRFFIPQLESDDFFAERMTLRLSPEAAINSPSSPFRPTAKVAHRADPRIRVGFGNHELSNTRLVPLRGWYPFELLHFSLRRSDQVARKYAARQDSMRGDRVPGAYITRAADAASEGSVDEILHSLGADPATVADGLASDILVRDTRLRDALRVLAGAEKLPRADDVPPAYALPPEGRPLMFTRPSVVDDVRFAVETAVLADADQIRAIRRFDELEGRVAELERRPGARLVRLLRRLTRRRGQEVGV